MASIKKLFLKGFFKKSYPHKKMPENGKKLLMHQVMHIIHSFFM